MENSYKMARQVVATMAMEGMELSESERILIERCALGQVSSQIVIKGLLQKYKAGD
ncbi:MAG: hypothetical protein PWP24_1057 [Clostridiales bacterium]|nr:hypothetical protein [Clostridiales bacterium]